MPNEQRKDQDDFIVVGGKRRWFSIPGSDQRIDDLQQRIKQERSLVIPDRPSESAWVTVNAEPGVFDHQDLVWRTVTKWIRLTFYHSARSPITEHAFRNWRSSVSLTIAYWQWKTKHYWNQR